MQTPPSDCLPEENPLPELAALATSETALDYKILAELIEDAETKREVLLKLDAIEDIRQASDPLKQEKIAHWATKLNKHPRTIERMLARVMQEGWASIIRNTRSDSGKLQGSKRWKPSLEYWIDFIQKTYKDGNKHSRRMSRNQVFAQVQAHATQELGLKEGEYPSHMFIYKVLAPLVDRKKIRNPGQGSRIIIKTTDEDIVVERSNQMWQIDHTKLDTLLANAHLELAGSLFLTAIIDSYSGCAMGFYLGFESAGSHEVMIALRHAILKKQYGADYELQKEWETHGLPEYIVTDRAKEFKSAHLKRVASELGFKLRFRAYPQQGGLVESLFDKLNKEVLSLLPGYKGSNIQKRPKDAEKYACITYEEFEKILTKYFVDHYNQHLYPRVADQTRLQRWWAGLMGGQPQFIDERRLDVCLMKSRSRKVQKYGSIQFENLIYQGSCLQELEGEKICLRYNPSNIVTLFAYRVEKQGQPSSFLGEIKSRDLEEERLSLKEWKDRKSKIQAEGKAIDKSSIQSERLGLNRFAKEKIKTLKQRRKAEQRRIDTKSEQHSNVNVVELFAPPPIEQNIVPLQTSVPESEVSVSGSEAEPAKPKRKIEPPKVIAYDWNQLLEDNW